MRKFSKLIKPENKDNFINIYTTRMKKKLRTELFEHILISEEKDYFSLDSFFESTKKLDKEVSEKILDEVLSELSMLGWKIKKSYGGTGIFIYSSENPPPNCWEDDGIL